MRVAVHIDSLVVDGATPADPSVEGRLADQVERALAANARFAAEVPWASRPVAGEVTAHVARAMDIGSPRGAAR